MKYQRTMPKDEERNYKIVSVGEHKFQITDIVSENEKEITIKAEVVSEDDSKGISLLYRISNDPLNKFFWLTKLFLKCITEPNEGDVVIDPDNFIGRQFFGEVKHSSDGKYANIKKMIYKEIEQPFRPGREDKPMEPKDIQWEN